MATIIVKLPEEPKRRKFGEVPYTTTQTEYAYIYKHNVKGVAKEIAARLVRAVNEDENICIVIGKGEVTEI